MSRLLLQIALIGLVVSPGSAFACRVALWTLAERVENAEALYLGAITVIEGEASMAIIDSPATGFGGRVNALSSLGR